MNDPSSVPPTGPVIYLIFCLAWIALFGAFGVAVFFPWMRAQSSELPVSMAKIAEMRLRRLPVGLLLDAWAELRKSRSAIRLETLEAFYRSHRREVRTSADLTRLFREMVGDN